MRRTKWVVGMVISALSLGACGQEGGSPEAEGSGSVMRAPLATAWAPNTAYAVGAQVTYGGRLYQWPGRWLADGRGRTSKMSGNRNT